MAMTMLDLVNRLLEVEKSNLTKWKLGEIMRDGTLEERIAAVANMERLGGYENLAD